MKHNTSIFQPVPVPQSPPEFDQVVLSGDIIRPGTSNMSPSQNGNIDWLTSVFSDCLRVATNKPVRTVRSAAEEGFDMAHFYHLFGFGLSAVSANWARVFDAPTMPRDAAQYVLDRFAGGLVIGLEIPHSFCKLFTENDIPYVDLTFHPIRYTPELTLGLRTNRKSIFDRMMEFSVCQSEHFIEAGLYRQKARPITLEDGPGALIAGQTIGDRVTIRNGGFVSLLTYGDAVRQVCESHETVYFKRHPLVRHDHDVIRFMAHASNVRFIEHNIYDLLASGMISDVYSLCSGVSHEARYFGARGHMFMKPFNRFSDLDGEDRTADFRDCHVAVRDWSLSAGWWRYVLGLSDHKPTSPPRFSSPSPLRDTLKQDWGLRPARQDRA